MSKLNIDEVKASLKELIDIAKKDQEFRSQLSELIGIVSDNEPQKKRNTMKVIVDINPISIFANEGVKKLVEELERLDIDQLVEVIKKYGLDKTRKSYKWKTKKKLVSLITEKISASSTRGDVFSGRDKSV